MGSIADTVYLKLPRFLQNIALSYYGYKQYKARYCVALGKPYDSISSHAGLPFDQLKNVQNDRLQVVVSHAAQYVPYYTRLLGALGVRPSDINIDNFTKIFPVLDKQQIISNPSDFHSTRFLKNGIRLFTSGTSGSPMQVLCSLEARAINYAYYRAKIVENGCAIKDRSVTFAGRILFAENESDKFWRKDLYTNTLYMSSYKISDSSLPAYVAALEEWQPNYVDSYPSAISEVAKYINRYNIKHGIKLKFVLTSSETLSDSQRLDITRAFNCPIIDHYGCTEMAVSAYANQGGGYYIDPLYSLVEYDLSPATEAASLICTGLVNLAMPLIRYRIGDSVSDIAKLADHSLFEHQAFGRINGREDDFIVTSDGRRIGRLDPAFKGVSGVGQAQIIQTSLSNLNVLVVPIPGSDYQLIESTLVHNLKMRTAMDMTISVNFVNQIPLTRSGKFRSVISKLKH